jgi:hypothetical protein
LLSLTGCVESRVGPINLFQGPQACSREDVQYYDGYSERRVLTYTMKSLTEVEGFISVLQFCTDLDIIIIETRFGCWTVNRNTDNTLHTEPEITQIGKIMIPLKNIDILN